MKIRDEAMRSELLKLNSAIALMIDKMTNEAEQMEIDVYNLRTSSGEWALAPLLAAKAQTLHGLTLLNQK